MQRIIPKLTRVLAVLLLGLAAAAGMAWLRQAIPVAAKPDPPFRAPGKPPLIESASIPWNRDPAHPVKVPQPIAIGGLAWGSSVDRPEKIDLTAAAVPWSTPSPNLGGAAPVAIQPAVLPWPLHQK